MRTLQKWLQLTLCTVCVLSSHSDTGWGMIEEEKTTKKKQLEEEYLNDEKFCDFKFVIKSKNITPDAFDNIKENFLNNFTYKKRSFLNAEIDKERKDFLENTSNNTEFIKKNNSNENLYVQDI